MAKSNKNKTIPYGPLQLSWSEQRPFGAAAAPPTKDPKKIYPSVPPEGTGGEFPAVDPALFEIPANGLTDDQRAAAVAQMREVIETQHAHFMGFQANQDERYDDYAWLMNMHVNNIGDPFTGGLFTLNSKFAERAVLDYFASLWNVDWPHIEGEKKPSDRYWGYILSMGFTEGNLYGLYNARDYLKGRMLIQQEVDPTEQLEQCARGKELPTRETLRLEALDEQRKNQGGNTLRRQPILFYSQDAHYSIVKSARILEIDTFYDVGNSRYPGQCPITQHLKGDNKGVWPTGVPSNAFDHDNPSSGEVNVEALKAMVEFFVTEGYPVAIVLNVGSTWKGAYDDVPKVNEMLHELGELHPELWEHEYRYPDKEGKPVADIRRRFWVHVDGALGAAYLPFLEMAAEQKKIEHRPVKFDFRNDAVMSIGCSLHKWFGFPMPAGVFMTRTRYQLQPPAKVGYIGSPDTTLGGSRSGLSPILIWDYFARMSYTDNMMKALACENASKYFLVKIQELEAELKRRDPKVDLWIARSKQALTVRFRMVNPALTYKYSVDNERILVPIDKRKSRYQERSFSHVYFMHSMGHTKADELIADLRAAAAKDWHDAFPTHDGDKPNPGGVIEVPMGEKG